MHVTNQLVAISALFAACTIAFPVHPNAGVNGLSRRFADPEAYAEAFAEPIAWAEGDDPATGNSGGSGGTSMASTAHTVNRMHRWANGARHRVANPAPASQPAGQKRWADADADPEAYAEAYAEPMAWAEGDDPATGNSGGSGGTSMASTAHTVNRMHRWANGARHRVANPAPASQPAGQKRWAEADADAWY